MCTHVHAPRCRPAAGAGPSPVDQQAPRDRQQTGHPLTVLLASGNRHDVTQLIGLSNAIPRVCGFRGRPRHRPGRLFADRDYDKYRRILRSRSITRKIARKDTSHGSGLGRNRWVFERTFTWLHQCGRAFSPHVRAPSCGVRFNLPARFLQGHGERDVLAARFRPARGDGWTEAGLLPLTGDVLGLQPSPDVSDP
ncbi:transposase [Streptomyces phaeofaciens]